MDPIDPSQHWTGAAADEFSQTRYSHVAQEQAVLERAQRIRHLQLHHSCADHIPAGKTLYGVQLSTMCVPDLRGTQGTFSQYTTRSRDEHEKTELGDQRRQLDFWPFRHQLPKTVLRRQGVPFWDYLDAQRITSVFYDLPSSYPPSPSQYGDHRCISGMGTPDTLGTYGTYQYFSEDSPFIQNVSSALGLFYTTGFQEDHKARSNGVFDDDEFRRQATLVLDERLALCQHAIENYEDGLLFFYFSSSDLQSHMFWWNAEESTSQRRALRIRHVLLRRLVAKS